MNFLQAEELSALMCTCRLFSDIGLQPLCMRSGGALRTPKQLISLLEFLRVGTQHTRAPLIKDVHFCLEEHRVPQDKASYFELHLREPAYFSASSNPLYEEHLLRASRNQALEAFLVVLQHCCELRRLQIDHWFEDVPTVPLYHAISNLTALEELRMPMVPRSRWYGDFKLASPSLRKLVLRPGRWHEIPDALTLLQPLSSTLVELDIPVCRWTRPRAPFPNVRRLAIEFPASEDVVFDLVHAFPDLTHLSLGGTRNFHLCHALSSRAEEDRLREHSQYQWHALASTPTPIPPWPSLVAVHAASACALYTLALPCKVPRVSVTYASGDPAEDMLPRILADTSPTCLEIRVAQAHYRYTPLPRRFTGLRPGDATASLERVVLTVDGAAVPDYVKVSGLLVDELKEALAPLRVTHVLVQHALSHFPAARAHTRTVVRTLCADARRRADALARAVPALRWVGVRVCVLGGPAWLYCWAVERHGAGRPQGVGVFGEANVQFGLTEVGAGVGLREMSEEEGWEVLRAEEMEEFAGASA
ncbi:hypothetical protein GSI_14257 [Ganoderma sinense ZZ0214-1]|uniref:F-box domain-containing protein n=1 Tax=Ganoderma sinense ZZ0214-1 TaxID=1077348 RepID=A0A2G8RSL5_9APHY|nr:hypothetical protein GSI_14257 [Ganoderma sinense ZZ0214-1]